MGCRNSSMVGTSSSTHHRKNSRVGNTPHCEDRSRVDDRGIHLLYR